MYGKIFASMFKGSLYGQWEAIVTFTVMIVLADQHGEVDMTAEALAATTSIPLEIIRKGIAQLEEADPKSRTPDEEGRRIIRVSDDRDWGWTITNYGHYRSIRTAEERREYFKLHKRKQRATHATASPPMSTGSPQSPPIAVSSKHRQKAGETTLDTEFDLFWRQYPKRAGGNSRTAALAKYRTVRRGAVTADVVLAGVQRYATYCQATGKVGTEYVKQAVTFLGPARHWEDPWDVPVGALPTARQPFGYIDSEAARAQLHREEPA